MPVLIYQFRFSCHGKEAGRRREEISDDESCYKGKDEAQFTQAQGQGDVKNRPFIRRRCQISIIAEYIGCNGKPVENGETSYEPFDPGPHEPGAYSRKNKDKQIGNDDSSGTAEPGKGRGIGRRGFGRVHPDAEFGCPAQKVGIPDASGTEGKNEQSQPHGPPVLAGKKGRTAPRM